MAFYVKVEDSKKLCYPMEDISRFDGEQLMAVRQLQIRGLAQMEKRMIDGKNELVYAIGGMQPLSQYLGASSNRANEREQFAHILESVLNLIGEVGKYPLLSTSNLVLDIDQLWIDARGELVGIYLPMMQDYQNSAATWKKLIQDLLARAESDDGLLFLTRQLRFAENQVSFSPAQIQEQIRMDGQHAPSAPTGGISNGTMAGQVEAGYGSERGNTPSVQPQMSPPPYAPQQSSVQPNLSPQPMTTPPPVPSQAMSPQTGSSPQPPRPNIQMMQAPNQVSSPVPPFPAKGGMQPKPVKVSKYSVAKLLIGHVVIVLIAVIMIFSGILKNKAGNWDLINVILLLLIVFGGLALIWLKLGRSTAGDSVSPAQPKAPKPAKGQAPKSAPGIKGKAPGIAGPATGAPGMGMPANAPQPAPIPTPVPPQMSAQPQRASSPAGNSAMPPQGRNTPVPPQMPPIYEEMPNMREAEGTMILSGGAGLQNEGTVVVEQESGAFLSVKKGDDKRKIVKSPFQIGRSADWKLSDSTISGIHCQIEIQEGKYYLVDIGSKNGTFLNGKRLGTNQYQVLNHGDEIRLGNTVIIFEVF